MKITSVQQRQHHTAQESARERVLSLLVRGMAWLRFGYVFLGSVHMEGHGGGTCGHPVTTDCPTACYSILELCLGQPRHTREVYTPVIAIARM